MRGGGFKKVLAIFGFMALLAGVGGASYFMGADKSNTDNRSRSLGLQKVSYQAQASTTPVPDNVPPTVSIKNPPSNAKVTKNTSIIIHADVFDTSGIEKVDFFVNGTLHCTDLTSIYSCDWKVPAKANVQYTLMAKAYDGSGNTAVSETIVTSK